MEKLSVMEKVKSIVKKIDGLHFEYNDWSRQNIGVKKYPACLYLLPVFGELHLHNGIFRDIPNAEIAFIDLDVLDFDGEQNDVVMERMKAFAKQFVFEVNKSGLFKQIPEKFTYKSVWDKLDDNVTGVVLEIRLEELQGVCVR